MGKAGFNHEVKQQRLLCFWHFPLRQLSWEKNKTNFYLLDTFSSSERVQWEAFSYLQKFKCNI